MRIKIVIALAVLSLMTVGCGASFLWMDKPEEPIQVFESVEELFEDYSADKEKYKGQVITVKGKIFLNENETVMKDGLFSIDGATLSFRPSEGWFLWWPQESEVTCMVLNKILNRINLYNCIKH